MIQINVENDDANDNIVTMMDNKLGVSVIPAADKYFKARESKGPYQIQDDNNNKGDVSWIATQANNNAISNQGNAQPQNNDTVPVHSYAR